MNTWKENPVEIIAITCACQERSNAIAPRLMHLPNLAAIFHAAFEAGWECRGDWKPVSTEGVTP
jgi:hypothetical protein